MNMPSIVSLIPTDLTTQNMALLLDRLLSPMWKPGWYKIRNQSPLAHRENDNGVNFPVGCPMARQRSNYTREFKAGQTA